jgi:dihydroceramidase
MTGMGAYFYLQWGIWLRHCLNYKQDNYELLWPSIFSIPAVVRRQDAPTGNGHNGSVKRASKNP